MQQRKRQMFLATLRVTVIGKTYYLIIRCFRSLGKILPNLLLDPWHFRQRLTADDIRSARVEHYTWARARFLYPSPISCLFHISQQTRSPGPVLIHFFDRDHLSVSISYRRVAFDRGTHGAGDLQQRK